jgi:hypothetical protein
MFGWRPRAAWDAIARDIVRQIGAGAAVTEFTHTDPDSVWQPMLLTIRYQIPGAVVRVGRYRMLRPGLALYDPWWADPSRAVELPQRQYPLDLRHTSRVVMNERIELPPGWRTVSLPPNAKGKFKQGSWRITAGLDNGALAYTREILVRDPAVPARDYQRLRQSLMDYLDARQGWAVLQVD